MCAPSPVQRVALFSAREVGSIVDSHFPYRAGEVMLALSSPAKNRTVDSLMEGANVFDAMRIRQAHFASSSIAAQGGDRSEAQGHAGQVASEVVVNVIVAAGRAK